VRAAFAAGLDDAALVAAGVAAVAIVLALLFLPDGREASTKAAVAQAGTAA
jgi:hypothetical protein